MSNAPISNPRLILSTCANEEEATRIAHALVESHLAACVNLLPGVDSIYRWQGKVERSREVLLFIKTDVSHVRDAEKMIADLHSYELAEFVVLEISGGSELYLQWLRESLK